ncbi:MAG: cell envelope integrity protein TolA [Deltaproteobacteria bacterium]|nr:cell envelope integrity protein TolA [Deltaproteobacteria bacterium]
MPKRLKITLSASLVLHLVIFGLFLFDPSFRLEEPKRYKVTMIKLSKGDGGKSLKGSYKKSKGLPQSTIQEQRAALRELNKSKQGSDLANNQSQTKKSVVQKFSQKRTADKGGINIDKRSSKKPSAISNALARIDQQLEQRDVDMGAAQTKNSEEGQSKWGGSEGTAVDPAMIMYYNSLKRKIQREWVLAKGEFSGSLLTKITVMIDARGNILRSSFKKTSGDGSFDASAMRAIRNSAPFPVPPNSIKQEALTEGFLIEFNPNSVTGRI